MPHVRLVRLCVLPLLATLVACSSTPTAQQDYCEDCLIRKSTGSREDGPDSLLQRAQRQARLAKVAEDRKEYAEAQQAWNETLTLISTLRAKHPNHPITKRLNTSDKLAGVTLSSIKLDRLPKLAQKILISSSVLGWARYEVESASRYQQVDVLMSLTGAYLDLGRYREATNTLDRVRSSVREQNSGWQRARIIMMEQAIKAKRPLHLAGRSGFIVACVLAPSACAVPSDLSAKSLWPQPAVMRSNGYPNNAYHGIQSLISMGKFDELFEFALRMDSMKLRHNVFATVMRHAVSMSDDALLDRALGLFSIKNSRLGPVPKRFEFLWGMFAPLVISGLDKPMTIKLLDSLERQVNLSQDIVWRTKHLASLSALLMEVNRLPQAKRLATQAHQSFKSIKAGPDSTKYWPSVTTALIRTGQYKAAQPLLATHLPSSDLDVWAGIARARIQAGQPQSLDRLTGLKPSVGNFQVLSSVAQGLLMHGKTAQAKLLVTQTRAMFASDIIQKEDPWLLTKLMGQLVVLSVLSQDTPQFNTDLTRLKEFVLAKLPQDRNHAFNEAIYPLIQSLNLSISLKYPVMERALLKEIKEVSAFKKGSHFSSRYSKPVFLAYLKAGRWDSMFTFLDSLPKQRSSSSGSYGVIVNLLQSHKTLPRPPAAMQRFQAEIISDLSNQKYYSFYNIVNFCKLLNTKVCVQEMISVAKDLDKTNTKQGYSNAVRSLSQALVSYKVDGSMGLFSELTRDYDKSYLLTQNLKQWVSDPALRKRNPDLPQQVEKLAKTLPKNVSSNILGARMYVLAIQGKCDKMDALFEEQKKKVRYFSSEYELALQVCVIHGQYVPAIKLIERFEPNGRGHQLISLGYALDISGASSRPDVKAELKRIAESLFDGVEERGIN